ncbi:MAG: lipopolysaccharide biosynthesis protein [Bacteroidales bacterium]|nr:lipopolysaccharide biosynthesis protein [Bacteroidales bacterium]
MATNLKSLAKDTAIYGVSSIFGRFLNYLLVPLYTATLSAASGGYGVITNLYAWTALLLVILTFGMETTFFRFANKQEEDAPTVYSTTLLAVGATALMFVAAVLGFLPAISAALGYEDHQWWVASMAIIVAMDAFQAIPFAYLRYQKKALKFAAFKLAFIFINILLNLLYFLILPKLKWNLFGIYDADFTLDVGYVFYINLATTGVINLLFWKELFCIKWRFDGALLKRMLGYSWPILVLGIAGILNQAADKILFPIIYEAADQQKQLGIYGAAVKIAMIMALITQAFRYAYEPFVFGKSKDKDNKETYAKAMKYFIMFTLFAFLAVIAGMDVLKHIIAPDYWEGLKVVPIVMAAEIFMGVYFNLSFWYKLIDKTIWGAVFSFAGCAVLFAINILCVPTYGYMACAWGGFAGYGTAMVLSYFVGQKYYPIAYPMKDIGIYTALAAALFALMQWHPFGSAALDTVYRCALMMVFFGAMFKREHMGAMFAKLPVVGKLFR